jgi:hypothetical protein
MVSSSNLELLAGVLSWRTNWLGLSFQPLFVSMCKAFHAGSLLSQLADNRPLALGRLKPHSIYRLDYAVNI